MDDLLFVNVLQSDGELNKPLDDLFFAQVLPFEFFCLQIFLEIALLCVFHNDAYFFILDEAFEVFDDVAVIEVLHEFYFF